MAEKKENKLKKILITGSNGFIAQNFIEKFAEPGFEIIGCDLFSPVGQKKDSFEQCDLSSKEAVRKLFLKHNFSYVIHLAACKKTGLLTANERAEMVKSNIIATLNLVRLAKESGVKKIIFASSMTVYGMPQYLPVDENHPLNPLDFYGFGKAVAEEIVIQEDLPSVILRFPGIFAFNRREGAIYNFISMAVANQDIHISAQKPIPWDILFIDDAVKAIELALMNEKATGYFNIGYSEPVELFSLAERIIRICRSDSKIIKDFPVEHPDFYFSVERGKNILGFSFPSLGERISQFVEILRYEKN